MPVDTGIYSSLLRPPKSVAEYDAEAQAVQSNALTSQLRRQQIEGNALNMRQAQQKQAEADADSNALRSLAGGWNAQTTAEQRIAGLRNSGRVGLMGQADTLEKQYIERTKGEAEARAKQAEVWGKVLSAQGDIAGRVLANPTPEAARAAVANMKAITQALGVQLDLSADEAAISQFQTPEQIKRWAAGHALKAKELLPTLQTTDYGGYKANESRDVLTGAVTVNGRTDVTESANNIANNARMAADAAAARAVTMRGQDLTDARSRESNAAAVSKPFEVTGPDGLPMLVQQDKKGNLRKVEGFGPKAGASKPLTEGQAKANLFGSRAQEANRIIDDLAAKGTERPGAIKGIAEATGNILGLGTESMGGALSEAAGRATNFTQSDAQQQVDQAQRDFINAVLRRESGAVIGAGEFRNAEQQYFPQPGDSAAVKKQKAKNRATAIQGILAEVPDSVRPKAPKNITVDW